MVSGFEKKVEMLKGKRDRVLLDVDAPEKNGKNIYPKVNSWLPKADKNDRFRVEESEGKKAKEDVNVVDELLQQDEFDKVSYQDVLLPIVVVPLNDFEDFDSRKLIFNKIIEAVKDLNVNIIGVHEMLGVSKTTLVKEVVRQVKEDKLFDSVGSGCLVGSDQSPTAQLSLESTSSQEQSHIPTSPRAVSFSGNSDSASSLGISPYPVLDAQNPLATKVAKKCGGPPIAIRTLASSLRNEPPYVWEDTLRQLMVRHLKASCLLLHGNTSMQFDIHDLISDMAKSITSKGNPVFVLRHERDLNDWPDDKTMKECHKIVCAGSFGALCLINCVLGYITLIGELKNLEIVIITSSDIEVLAKERWKEKAKTRDEVLDSCSPSGKRTDRAMGENLERLRNKCKKNNGRNREGLDESSIRIVRRELSERASPFKAAEVIDGLALVDIKLDKGWFT
ncbi:hypothetical protein GOBAR_DD19072 [Gossypium barbadense]|nr:hypothetical protein GOBAR_DD19072 [Gossypium barbadense]